MRPHVLADDVVEELSLLAGADVFVLIYPIWFGTPPAMMKGYIDRVLGAGFPYRAIRDREPHALLTGKRLVSFTASGTTRSWLEEQGAWRSLRTLYDQYLANAFSLATTKHIHFDAVSEDLAPRFVRQHLHKVEEAARSICSQYVHVESPDQQAPHD